MSKMGEMMSKLADLEKTDPAKAKQVLQQIATTLNDAASSATGGDADHLKDLATKFSQAASSGDLSALQPKGGHPPGPPPSSDPATSSSTSQTQKYKHHGHKHDASQVESIMASAMSSVDGTDSTDAAAAA